MSFYKNRIYFKTKEFSMEKLKEIFSHQKISYLTVVVLFGSRATGNFHQKSDYDFAIYTSLDVVKPVSNRLSIVVGSVYRSHDHVTTTNR